jgi:solute carrier family 25 aspartate/glutamate transporter 12/13
VWLVKAALTLLHPLSEFTQLMKGLQGERLRQAFRHFDQNQDGYIEKRDFSRIIYELARHKLSDSVLANLENLGDVVPDGKISYSECIAFHNVRCNVFRGDARADGQ